MTSSLHNNALNKEFVRYAKTINKSATTLLAGYAKFLMEKFKHPISQKTKDESLAILDSIQEIYNKFQEKLPLPTSEIQREIQIELQIEEELFLILREHIKKTPALNDEIYKKGDWFARETAALSVSRDFFPHIPPKSSLRSPEGIKKLLFSILLKHQNNFFELAQLLKFVGLMRALGETIKRVEEKEGRAPGHGFFLDPIPESLEMLTLFEKDVLNRIETISKK